MAAKIKFKDMPRAVKAFRIASNVFYGFAALGLLGAALMALSKQALIADDGTPIDSPASMRILAGIVFLVTLSVLLTAFWQRSQSDAEGLEAERTVLIAGGSAGVFISLTLPRALAEDAKYGALLAIFLVPLLMSSLFLSVPIEWARRCDRNRKKRETIKAIRKLMEWKLSFERQTGFRSRRRPVLAPQATQPRPDDVVAKAPVQVERWEKAAGAFYLVGAIAGMAFPVSYLLPTAVWQDNPMTPSWLTRSAAALVLIPVVVVSVTAYHQWKLRTTEGFKSTQRILFGGGAVGSLLLVALWTRLDADAQAGMIGGLFLMLLAGAGVLLEPVITWSMSNDEKGDS